ncbi:MATE family efflux transporter [Lachnospiraceae bacterium HCP1S3_C3]|nr:MATE family efflux transporter [Lachnospiraceae bacterium]MDD6857955.1 MATE family efflux transporter [Lachnospiraceae bacterium]
MKQKKYEMDMCSGPLLKKILIFTIPVMASGILQLLFNATDIIVVGRYAGKESLAAVGSTTALINLIINLFVGLSVGANVITAKYYGAGKEKDVSETVHTAILTAVISGIILVIIGIILATPLLKLMDSPEDVLGKSALYLKIYFLGMPAMMLYNFGSAVLRAVGDTKRPLYYLILSGSVNVCLNLISVICFGMGVAGVGIATVVAQYISAAMVVRCLIKEDGSYGINLSELRLTGSKLKEIMFVGIPAGMQGVVFALSNVLIQSSINSFGSIAMAGNTAASNIEGFIYISMNSYNQTAISFTSQNIGGKKIERVGKILLICIGLVSMFGIILGFGAYFAGNTLLHIYSSDMEVIHYGLMRMRVICLTYFTCGIMDVFAGSVRGMGYSVMPMIISLIGACGLRIVWIYTIFKAHHTLTTLYISYPVTWVITICAYIVCYTICIKKVKSKL